MDITQTIKNNIFQFSKVNHHILKSFTFFEKIYRFIFFIATIICVGTAFIFSNPFDSQIINNLTFLSLLMLAMIFGSVGYCLDTYFYDLFLQGKKSKLLWMISIQQFEKISHDFSEAKKIFFDPHAFEAFFEYLINKRADISDEFLENYDLQISYIKSHYLNQSLYVFSHLSTIFSLIQRSEEFKNRNFYFCHE